MSGATMTAASLYGRAKFASGSEPDPSQTASGVPDASPAPALFWIALVGLLVAARLLYEMAD